MLPAVLERWTASIATGESVDMEFPLRGADGVFRTFLTRAEPLKDSSGRVVRWFGTNTDISSIKATEDRLRDLVDSEKESARLSEALNDVNKAAHSTLEIDEVMQHALEAGSSALGCDSGAIEMREGDEWVVRYQTGFSRQDVGMRLSEAEAPNATRAARQEAPLAIEDMTGDETINVGFVQKYGLKSVLAVPLRARGEVSGCALFYTSAATRRFTDAEIDFGRKLGAVVSLGLENARLYAVERNTAQTLQQALLTMPESLRGIEFANSYRSATESTLVGGDFYDIFELDDDRIGITIGDISGKGLAAAVLTSLVKDTIRAHANERTKTPAEVLTLTNDLVYRSTPTESFATVFFGILDRRDGRLSFANSGHTTAAILKPGGQVQGLPVTDPILGAFAHVEYGESEARVESGEILFLYTDGLTEARRGMEMYGEERLFALLSSAKVDSAEDAVDEALVDVLTFSEGRLRDDLAILALRRLGAVGE
jgi:serine phosphatase RsbU (regulator of sigma subunit)